MRRLLTPFRLLVAGGALLAAVALAAGVLFLVPANGTYIFLPDEAHPVDPLVTVEGRADADGPGGIYFVDVIVRKATLAERFFPSIREGASLVSAEAVNPGGLSDQQRRSSSLRVMSRSQQIAAAVALRELGLDVKAQAIGAFVAQVIGGSPAAGKIHPADVIVGVDGRSVRSPAELRARLASRGPGASVAVRLRRADEELTVSLTTAPDPTRPGRGIIGVFVEPAVNVQLPVSVRIDSGNVGGPSAGLAFALDLLEELGRDVDRGRRVAATGEIQLDGTVTEVGGIRQKTIGARRTGVDAFIVPAGDNAQEARRYADGLRIIPVRTFQQALRALATLPPSGKDQ